MGPRAQGPMGPKWMLSFYYNRVFEKSVFCVFWARARSESRPTQAGRGAAPGRRRAVPSEFPPPLQAVPVASEFVELHFNPSLRIASQSNKRGAIYDAIYKVGNF